MINPERMHLISEIPEPAAYLAKDWTSRAATKDNAAFRSISSARVCPGGGWGEVPHRKQHIYEPTCYRHRAPQVPRVTPTILVTVQFPAAELLVQPPAIRAVAHLDVREPLRDDREDRSIDSDASTCEMSVDGLRPHLLPDDAMGYHSPTMLTTNHDCEATSSLRT